MNGFERPPLRVNRNFFYESENIFKLLEIALGICCAIFNAQCFPNDVVLRCTYTMHSVTQLFSVVCVNAFFLVTTTALVLCNLFGVVDSYYKFNFPVVERRVYLLTVIMYIVSLIMVIAAISQSRFVSAWVFPLIFTALTTVTYVYDLIRKYDGSP
ncbi:unnamed protein product [Cylicocyclus nassatus]|uniref:MARVEL domain-containing protein n=1 Tax=Cylicocyclus nassatus TaxID=53992 RepID=A0AA36MHY2_CYLNA|nr:unnamed protein product [Cylicocyclus nassatus]